MFSNKNYPVGFSNVTLMNNTSRKRQAIIMVKKKFKNPHASCLFSSKRDALVPSSPSYCGLYLYILVRLQKPKTYKIRDLFYSGEIILSNLKKSQPEGIYDFLWKPNQPWLCYSTYHIFSAREMTLFRARRFMMKQSAMIIAITGTVLIARVRVNMTR